MKTRTPFYNNADLLAGTFFLALGGFWLYIGTNYPMGTAIRMGPGYFPWVLSLILICFGLIVFIRGLRTGGPAVTGSWGWKPLLFITLGILAFGFIMPRFGMVPALVAMFFLAAFGGHEFHFLEVLIMTVIMTVLAAGIFVYGLGLPYQLFGTL